MMCNFCGAIHTNNVECHIGDLKDTAIERFHELERLRTQLAGHTDQAVEDTLSDLMTKYDVIAKENVALRDVLKKVDASVAKPGGFYAFVGEALSTPSPQVAKIEAVLEAAENWLGHKGSLQKLGERGVKLIEAIRNLRGDK